MLYSSNVAETEKVLVDEFGLTKVDEDDTYFRYEAEGDIGNVIDIKKVSSGKRGTMGVGTVHHIAWRTKDDEEQLAWRKQLNEHGYFVTDVKDRNYFNAIYFREPGEILFEIATDPPGFAHDESYETMGEGLMLPSQYEQYRAQLEERLIPIHSVRKQ